MARYGQWAGSGARQLLMKLDCRRYSGAGGGVFKGIRLPSRMRQMLRMISLYGTGRSADCAGLTGSAARPDPGREERGRGLPRKTSLVSSFAAALPAHAPRPNVRCPSVVDEPRDGRQFPISAPPPYTAAPVGPAELVPADRSDAGRPGPTNAADSTFPICRYLVDKHLMRLADLLGASGPCSRWRRRGCR